METGQLFIVASCLVASLPLRLSLPVRDDQQSRQSDRGSIAPLRPFVSQSLNSEPSQTRAEHSRHQTNLVSVSNVSDYPLNVNVIRTLNLPMPQNLNVNATELEYHNVIMDSDSNVTESDSILSERYSKQRELLMADLSTVRFLLSKTFDFSSTAKGLRLMLRQTRLNRRNLKLTVADVTILLPLLHSESFEDRMYVWGKTAMLAASQKGFNRKSKKTFFVEKLDKVEGDMIFSRDGIDKLVDDVSVPVTRTAVYPTDQQQQQQHESSGRHAVQTRVKRKIISDTAKYWSGPIPWKVDDKKFSIYELDVIKEAIKHWEARTCIRFTDITEPSLLAAIGQAAPKTNRTIRPRDRVYLGFPKDHARNHSASTDPNALQTPHLRFKQNGGCFSYVGKLGNGQEISIGPGCAEMGIVAHELGHAIGFYHEHVRPDRDLYVGINKDNMQPGHDENFAIKDWSEVITNGIPYDYSSLMHYSGTEWSLGHKIVIQAKDAQMQKVMGQRQRLSFLDVKLANYQFCSLGCREHTSLDWDACAQGGFRNPNACDECLCPQGWSPPTCQDVEPGQNVDCGQTSLVAGQDSQVLNSPTFEISRLDEVIYCAWHISVPVGKRIKLTIAEHFRIEYDQLSCEDYIEVRFKGVHMSGPRLCSSTVTTHEFVTFDHEVLLLFHTKPGAVEDSQTRWFRASYQLTDGCGGCTPEQVAISLPACKKFELYDCSQDFTQDCGEGKTCPGRRQNNCYREAPYCCPPYRLQGDSCELPQFRAATSRKEPWGAWSDWTTCSGTCGGCGWQSRERQCLKSRCRGDFIEWERCAMMLCPLPDASTTPAQCKVESLGTCVKHGRKVPCVKSRLEPCPADHLTRRCCAGLTEDSASGLCVEAPSAG